MEEILTIHYHRYSNVEQMENADRMLLEAAIEASEASYSPYSRFRVGAAVRLGDGTVIKGANQENAAFPSGLCAERTAMFAAAASHPGVAQESIAIAAFFSDGTMTSMPVSPCGACRQVMAEYQKMGGKPMSVILGGKDAIFKFDRVDDVLPFIFDSI